MTSKERVIKTITFTGTDKLVKDIWVLPGTISKYGNDVTKLYEEIDFAGVRVDDPCYDPRAYKKGTYTDVWGCGWLNMQDGIIGEVKNPPLIEDSKLDNYKTPKSLWTEQCFKYTDESINSKKDKFLSFGGISLFERMQFLRGTENLYMDIAEENDFFFKLRDMVVDYYDYILTMVLRHDLDAIQFFDDWGSQRALLISPNSWDRLFRPAYEYLIKKIKDAGKYVFFHSDGYILDLYSRFIELGINAVNSQIWCMGIDEVSAYAGKITFWGELSRQTTLPKGTTDEIEKCVSLMKQKLFVNGGGLIGQFEAGPDVSLENIYTAFYSWDK